MVKKKRQNDPHDDNSTSESGEDKQANNSQGSLTTSGCQHVNHSVETTKLRKLFKTACLATECSECVKSSKLQNSVEDDDGTEYDKTLWLCLKCGTQLCGRRKCGHALHHYETPRSDMHALTLNTTTFQTWCYICDDEVSPTARKKLQECVEFIKKKAEHQPSPLNSPDDKNTPKSPKADMLPIIPLTDGSFTFNNHQAVIALPSSSGPALFPGTARRVIEDNSLPRVRGLSNLGNTCFFNAVLQCLAQTPYLLEVLKEHTDSNALETVMLPGGKCKLTNDEEVELPPINGALPPWRPLTKALAETLETLQQTGDVVSPSTLFYSLIKKCPQFRGGDQHDSHELLRQLLETVRSEDLERYKILILQNVGYKKAANQVEDDLKQKCKFYAEQANERILKPDQVFRGILVSILTCTECYNTSPRRENFLDLSLPVTIEKPQPPTRRKNSPEPVVGPSKHQLKKEKEKERKAKRAQKHHNKRQATQPIQNFLAGQTDGTLTENKPTKDTENNSNSRTTSSSSSEQSDADVEDNLTDDKPMYVDNMVINRTVPPLHDANGNNELPSPYGPEKRGDSPENPNKDSDDDENDSGIATSPANTVMLEKGNTFQNAENTSTLDDGLCLAGISEQGAAFVRQRSQCAENEGPPSHELDKMSLEDRETFLEAKHRARMKRMRKKSYTDWSTTIAPRNQSINGECSIQSCLNNFTAIELMTGNNKVECSLCTKHINGEKGKKICTNATKQFLISSPPAVLILHLKRFQVGLRFMFRKIVKHVSFPVVLDIAPLCSSKIKNPNVGKKQTKLLYALYGIVEHSGNMHGGHYTAYVKVRQKLSPDDPRWRFLPKGNKAEIHQVDEQSTKLDELLQRDRENQIKNNDINDYTSSSTSTSEEEVNGGADDEGAVGGTDEPDIVPPPGKWYYVSDSFVQETTEQKALDAQAYLLFYERIY